MSRRSTWLVWPDANRPALLIGTTVAVLAAGFAVELLWFAVVMFGGYCVSLGGRVAWVGWGIIVWAMVGWIPNAALALRRRRRRRGRPMPRHTTPAPPPSGLWDRELDAGADPTAQYERASARIRG